MASGRIVHPNGGAPVSSRATAAAANSTSFRLFVVLVPGVALVLLLVGALALPEEARPAPGSYLHARLKTRWQGLHARLRSVTSRRRRLREEAERAAAAKANHEKEEAAEKARTERVIFNASSRTWEQASVNASSGGSGAATNDSTRLAPDGSAAAAASRVHPLLARARAAAAVVTLHSPPPPLGPAMLLRYGREGGCLHWQDSLELLARGSCEC